MDADFLPNAILQLLRQAEGVGFARLEFPVIHARLDGYRHWVASVAVTGEFMAPTQHGACSDWVAQRFMDVHACDLPMLCALHLTREFYEDGSPAGAIISATWWKRYPAL